MATVQDVYSAALIRLGLPADDGYVAPPDVMRTLVSTAHRDVASEMDWPELHVEGTFTVSADPPYALPAGANFIRLDWVYVLGSKLRRKQREELFRYQVNDSPVAQGEPSTYYAVGVDDGGTRVLWIAPRPANGTVVTWSYLRKPPPVYNPTDQLVIPDHLIEAVVVRTAVLIVMMRDDTAQLPVWMAEYSTTLARLRDEDIDTGSVLLPRVRQDWG